MKTYEAIYMPQDQICWEKVEAAQIDNCQGASVPHIKAWAKVCWNEEGLHVRLQAVEKDILCRFNGETDPICEDSCLEFFVSPDADGRYFNLESNPNGALYFGFGYNRYQHLRLLNDELRQLLNIRPFRTEDGWGVEATIPLKIMQIFSPDICLAPGKVMTANFYKCGDATVIPHYLTWNRVEVTDIDFHLPEFFGKLILK